jgi:hypothetical protein
MNFQDIVRASTRDVEKLIEKESGYLVTNLDVETTFSIADVVEQVLLRPTHPSDMGVAWACALLIDPAVRRQGHSIILHRFSGIFPPLAIPSGVCVKEAEGVLEVLQASSVTKFLDSVLQERGTGSFADLNERACRVYGPRMSHHACLAFLVTSYLTNVSVSRRNLDVFPDFRGILDMYVPGLSINEQSRIHTAIMVGCQRGMYSHVKGMLQIFGDRSMYPLRCRSKVGRELFMNCRPDTKPGKTANVSKTGHGTAVFKGSGRGAVQVTVNPKLIVKTRKYNITSAVQQSLNPGSDFDMPARARQLGVGIWDSVYGVLSIPQRFQFSGNGEWGSSGRHGGTPGSVKDAGAGRTVDLGSIELPATEVLCFTERVECNLLSSAEIGTRLSSISDNPDTTYKLFKVTSAQTCFTFPAMVFYNLVCMTYIHERSQGTIYPDIYSSIEGLDRYKPLLHMLWGTT